MALHSIEANCYVVKKLGLGDEFWVSRCFVLESFGVWCS